MEQALVQAGLGMSLAMTTHSQPLVPVRSSIRSDNYIPTTASGCDVDKEKFAVTLVDVDDVTPNTSPTDVVVSCPPANRDGYLVIAMGESVYCKRGPGFPEVKGQPHVKINVKQQTITVTLSKATKGRWMETWRNLRY